MCLFSPAVPAVMSITQRERCADGHGWKPSKASHRLEVRARGSVTVADAADSESPYPVTATVTETQAS